MDPYVHPYFICDSKGMVHSVGTAPRNSDLGNDDMSFVHTFDAYEGELMMDVVLQLARENILEGISESEGSLPD